MWFAELVHCGYVRVRMRFVVPKPSVSKWLAMISLSLVCTRLFVLFCESFSAIRSERMADEELLELCGRGAAADSVKFRSLCLNAKADRAAPLLLKAALRAVKTSFQDFTESFSSPSRIALLALFCLSGLALPVVRAITSFLQLHAAGDVLARLHGAGAPGEEDQEECNVVVLNGGANSTWRSRLRPRFGTRGRAKMLSLGSAIEECEDAEPAAVWTPIRLGSWLGP